LKKLTIRRIGVASKPRKGPAVEEIARAIEWLEKRDIEVFVDRETAGLLRRSQRVRQREKLPELCDALLVFGGDGTLLSMARQVRGSGTPIMAVNIGGLGFLTSIRIEELFPALEKLLTQNYSVDRRSMLHASIQRKSHRVEQYLALNDVVVNKGALARIISLEVFSDDELVSDFLADGLIVASPTGSTAYSLSAGGPIVHPTLQAIVITPICPHTLTNRPIVIPPDSIVRVCLKTGRNVMLTIDGQIGMRLQVGDEVTVTRSKYQVELLRPWPKNFFEVLREKMKWGER